MCEGQSELLPARILDLQGRELHGRGFVHGALARWIGDGFHNSSPCVGHISRALALMIGSEWAIGKKKKRDTHHIYICSAPTQMDVDSFASWADVLQVLCGAYCLHDRASWPNGTSSEDTTSEQSKPARTKAQQHCSRDTLTHATPHMTPTSMEVDSYTC